MKGALRNFTKFTGKNLCQSLFFHKIPGLRPATLFKKRLQHRCFQVISFNSNFFIFFPRGRIKIKYQIKYPKMIFFERVNPLRVNPTKWSNTLKQFVGKLRTNCLKLFDHFMGLAFKELKIQFRAFICLFATNIVCLFILWQPLLSKYALLHTILAT